MESILELKPILMRMFGEVEQLHATLRERDERIRHLESTIEKLTKENAIYQKVVRMYEGITGDDDEQPAQQQPVTNEVVHDSDEDDEGVPIPLRPEAPTAEQQPIPSQEREVTVNEVKRGRRKKPSKETEEEKAERMREYHRQYRMKRKEAKK
jgi:type IV secretory pathway VirB10-like protein